MTTAPIVSNSSPLIALERIGQQPLLEALFGRIVIPMAVVQEVGLAGSPPPWIESRSLTTSIGPRILAASLGGGESEAISLALETQARLIILDDRPARRLAQSLHLPVIGTVGVLVAAKRRNLLVSIRPQLDALMQHDFRISPRLYDQVLIDVDE
ncbi:MAG: DUF3368 domain-containing protein [Chloroflexota bacterium]|nr:DUF3368 domain-containing protein [Chloroflexota bacterium]